MDFFKKKWDTCGCYVLFTAAFIPAAVFLSLLFKDAGMNFIRQTDGIAQHFNAMLYLARYVRSIVTGIFKGGISAPLMNYTMGRGADIITTLNGYDFFNPVCLLAVVLFRNDLIFAFEFMLIFNLYLAGVAFCFYCRTIGRKEGWSIASGAMIYAFCGYAMHYGLWAPIFMSGVILLPVLLACAELMIEKKRWLPLVIAVFLSLMINYYTFFMNAVFSAVYLIIRLFPCPKDEIKQRLASFFGIAGVVAVGGLLSSVWLFPAFFGTLLNNGGYQLSAGYYESKFFYPADYYLKLIEKFTYSVDGPGYWNFLGFVPIAMISLWVLFILRTKKLNRLRVAVCVGFAAMCIPYVGLALNGFRYVNNRWTYSFALVVAFAFVETAADIPRLPARHLITILLAVMGLILLWFNDPSFEQMQYVPLMTLLLTTAVVLIAGRPFVPRWLVPPAFLVLIVFSTFANITVQCKADYGGDVCSFCNADEGYGIYTKYSSSKVANTADDTAFYRTEMQEERPNTEGYNNVRGTSFYYSAIDGNFQRYYRDMQLTTCKMLHQMHGLSGCRALLDMASVKYYTIPTEDEAGYVPFGYSEVADGVYENDYYLPPAFLYDKHIAYGDFMDMNPSDRQQALLQGAVLDESPDSVPQIYPSARARDIEYSVISDNVYWENNWISTGEAGGTLTFVFDPQPGCELFLWLDGIELDKTMTNRYLIATGGYLGDDENEQITEKAVTLSSPKYSYYVDREGVNYNLGYSESGFDYCRIELEGNSNYWCNGIHVLAVPMDKYVEDVNVLRASACDDITIADDRIYGTVTCDTDSILQISVPYSIGWKAYVDGKKARVLKSDLMYAALELAPGSHEIRMRYFTPSLKAGIAVSLITLSGIVVFSVVRKKGAKRGAA